MKGNELKPSRGNILQGEQIKPTERSTKIGRIVERREPNVGCVVRAK